MSHTNEELARIYGAYIGCNLTWERIDWQTSESYSETFLFTPDILIERIIQENMKLILTPHADISNDDAFHVAQLAGYSGSVDRKTEAGKELIHKYLKSSSCNVRPFRWFEILDYLRSRGYDVGFGGIPSLIESGIAISTKTV